MSKEFKTVLFGLAFACLSFYFFTLSFPTKETLALANQKCKVELGVSWQSASFADFGVVDRFGETTIFSQNAPVVKFKSGYIINCGALIFGIFNNLEPTQKIVDFSASTIIAIYSPLAPKTLKIFGWGDFGSLNAALNSKLLSVNILPSDKLNEFKSSPLGAKLLSGFQTSADGIKADYAF